MLCLCDNKVFYYSDRAVGNVFFFEKKKKLHQPRRVITIAKLCSIYITACLRCMKLNRRQKTNYKFRHYLLETFIYLQTTGRK